MSTKIYNMYMYHESIFELMLWLKKFKRLYERAATREVSDLIGSCYGPTNEKKKYELWTKSGHFSYFELVRLLRDEIRIGLNDSLNIDASVVVYPYEERIFVQFFGLRFGLGKYSKWLQEHIDKNERFSDYSYWDNSDPPDDVGQPTWDRRGEFFDKLFKQYSYFSSAGISYELSNSESLYNIARHVAIWREANKNIQEVKFWGEKDEEDNK